MRLSFTRTKPCEACPWRKDMPIGRLSGPYIERMRETCDVGYGLVFPCQISSEVCAGYLLSPDSLNNSNVLFAIHKRRFNPALLTTDVPLYVRYVEMAAANGVKLR